MKDKFTYRILLVPIILFALIELLSIIGIFDRPELVLYDNWFRLQGTGQIDEQIIVIGIDDDTIEKLGAPPLSRTLYANLLSHLSELK